MNSRLQFTYSVALVVFFIVLKHNHSAFQLILSSGGGGGGGLVDHLRGHQDHVVIFFVAFNLTHMSFVGSGSLLCRVIDARPVSYLGH